MKQNGETFHPFSKNGKGMLLNTYPGDFSAQLMLNDRSLRTGIDYKVATILFNPIICCWDPKKIIFIFAPIIVSRGGFTIYLPS